ncbi:MAG TPA: hypothetical protein DDW52_12885 [Planctomycetaceae bacterium]|nr:hypothetical protein [Planctomycetaceae bacterium]
MSRIRAKASRNATRRKQRTLRAGTVATEMAVCLPILFMVFLGSIDLIRYNLLRNVITHATYEAARTGIVKGATIEDVQQVVETELDRFAAPLEYTITTDPAVLPAVGSETLTITITCDVREAGWILSDHFPGDTMQESMTIQLE